MRRRTIEMTMVVALLVLLAGSMSGCTGPFGNDDSSESRETPANANAASAGGVLLDEPYPAPDFTLVSHEGEPYRLSDYRGQVIAVFFGYTGCPDICPMTLGYMAQATEALGDEAADVQFLLITVDPERDDPERLASYVGRIEAPISALTGERDELERVWEDYDIVVERHDREDGNYLVDHSAQVWLIGPAGDLAMFVPMGGDGDDLTAGIRALLEREV